MILALHYKYILSLNIKIHLQNATDLLSPWNCETLAKSVLKEEADVLIMRLVFKMEMCELIKHFNKVGFKQFT